MKSARNNTKRRKKMKIRKTAKTKKNAKMKEASERTLLSLAVGESGRITALSDGCVLKRRLTEHGLSPGACITCVGASPLGDPRAYAIRGCDIAIRQRDAEMIFIAEA